MDGRLDGGAGVGNVVVFRIFAGNRCARYIYGHRFIHPGVRTVKGAGQSGNDNLIPRQNALFHNGMDSGVRIGVIGFIIRRHGGGDGLLTRGERPGGGGVLIVDHTGVRVLAGFGRFHRGLSIANDGDLSALVHRRHVRAVNRDDLPSDKAVARAAGRTQDKLIPVGDRVGLFGDGQGLLGP